MIIITYKKVMFARRTIALPFAVLVINDVNKKETSPFTGLYLLEIHLVKHSTLLVVARISSSDFCCSYFALQSTSYTGFVDGVVLHWFC